MHQEENMGEVELATVSFGQSFQITPIQLAVTVSSLINGGRRVTPHFGTAVSDREQTKAEELVYPVKEGIVSSENLRTNKRNSGKSCFSGIRKKCRDRRDITLAEKQQPPRHCPEVPADIFPPSWDLRLQKILRCWACVLFMIQKEFITGGPLQHR